MSHFQLKVRKGLAELTGREGPLRSLGNVTISVGLSNGTEPNLQSAMRIADMRLYEAKHGGRNRTVAS